MRGSNLIRQLTTILVLMVGLACLVHAQLAPTRIAISDHPNIIFSTGSALRVITARRYPSVPFAIGNKAPFPGGGVLHVSCAGQQMVVAYLAYNPKFAAAQASKYGEMQRVRLRRSRPRSTNPMLDYSGYQFRSARGLQIAEGVRTGKRPDGHYAGIIEVVASNHEGECDITSVVTGKNKADVGQQLKQLRPVFDRISATITIG